MAHTIIQNIQDYRLIYNNISNITLFNDIVDDAAVVLRGWSAIENVQIYLKWEKKALISWQLKY